MHLSTVAFVGRVNDNASAIRAETRVCIASPFTFVLRGQIETAERNFLLCLDIVEVDVLFSLFIGVGVV